MQRQYPSYATPLICTTKSWCVEVGNHEEVKMIENTTVCPPEEEQRSS